MGRCFRVTTPLLLDTCALVWISNGDTITDQARGALDALWVAGYSPQVSPISAWEVGLLVARGRLALTMPPDRWWERSIALIGLEIAPMSPALLIASTQLPGMPPNDPADRIVAATAREQGLRVMTRDAKLLAYAEAGHLDALSC
jgi:PIN domain nuclease of toxin-antitoxin system